MNKDYSSQPYERIVDLDLSLVLYDKDLENRDWISYTRPKNDTFDSEHSGDITDAPNGATEYIDFSKKAALDAGYRYAVMSVLNYSHQPLMDVPEASAGIMTLSKEDKSSELYDPKRVQRKFDLSSALNTTVPLIIDLKENVAYWADIKWDTHGVSNNVENNNSPLKRVVNTITKMEHTSMYELFMLHAKARGELIEEKPKNLEGVTVFDVPTRQQPLDISDIVSNYV